MFRWTKLKVKRKRFLNHAALRCVRVLLNFLPFNLGGSLCHGKAGHGLNGSTTFRWLNPVYLPRPMSYQRRSGRANTLTNIELSAKLWESCLTSAAHHWLRRAFRGLRRTLGVEGIRIITGIIFSLWRLSQALTGLPTALWQIHLKHALLTWPWMVDPSPMCVPSLPLSPVYPRTPPLPHTH